MSSSIRLITINKQAVCIDNSMYDYLDQTDLTFEFGKSYALLGDFGMGGHTISMILSGSRNETESYPVGNIIAAHALRNSIPADTRILVDGVEDNDFARNKGWLVGRSLYSKITGKERSLSSILDEYKSKDTYSDVLSYFDISAGMIKYISQMPHEKWRVSSAVGLLSDKKIFCYPYMNSRSLLDTFYFSSNALCVKKINEMGGTVIIPTNDLKLVSPLVDEVIEIDNHSFSNLDMYADEQRKRMGI